MPSKTATRSIRTERKKTETKQKIISAAVNLFNHQGIAATSMEQIAAEADIAKGTLYNYFPVKEAIIDDYVQQSFINNHTERINNLQQAPDTRTRLILLLTELIEGVQRQPEVFEKFLVYQVQNMLSLKRGSDAKSSFRMLADTIISLGQNNGEIRNDLPSEILTALIEFAFIEVAQQFYTKPATFRACETIERCVDLCINGLKPSS